MFKKLDELLKREEFLSEQLLNPDVIADMGTWQKYSKEHSDLRETADKYREYMETERQMNDAFAMAEEETDAEMRKMLTDEGYLCKERLAAVKDEFYAANADNLPAFMELDAEMLKDFYGMDPDWRAWRYAGWIPRYLELFALSRQARQA